MKPAAIEKRYSDATGKLHIPCPHYKTSGICIHVVIKDGFCYRSEQCMVVGCKFNHLQSDIRSLLSLMW